MKECDNSKILISSNFMLSISLLIMFDTLLLRLSLHCNTPLHFTTNSFTITATSPQQRVKATDMQNAKCKVKKIMIFQYKKDNQISMKKFLPCFLIVYKTYPLLSIILSFKSRNIT
jgi:hypothetical protein